MALILTVGPDWPTFFSDLRARPTLLVPGDRVSVATHAGEPTIIAVTDRYGRALAGTQVHADAYTLITAASNADVRATDPGIVR